jgi:hypothetical protein
MNTIPDINEPIRCQITPSTWVTIRVRIVESQLIPALSRIMGAKDPDENAILGLFLPLRALLVTENPDRTYAVLNDLGTIAPEASRSAAEYVIAFHVEFDPDRPDDESALRTLLALVEPVRQARTVKQYIKDAQRGSFDALAPLYAGNRVDPRKRVAASSMLPFGQLARSTFQRICRALVAPKKETKPKIEKKTDSSGSAAPAAIGSPNQQRHTRNDDRIPISSPAIDFQDLSNGEQGELF